MMKELKFIEEKVKEYFSKVELSPEYFDMLKSTMNDVIINNEPYSFISCTEGKWEFFDKNYNIVKFDEAPELYKIIKGDITLSHLCKYIKHLYEFNSYTPICVDVKVDFIGGDRYAEKRPFLNDFYVEVVCSDQFDSWIEADFAGGFTNEYTNLLKDTNEDFIHSVYTKIKERLSYIK